jgi:hypothetical protein
MFGPSAKRILREPDYPHLKGEHPAIEITQPIRVSVPYEISGVAELHEL